MAHHHTPHPRPRDRVKTPQPQNREIVLGFKKGIVEREISVRLRTTTARQAATPVGHRGPCQPKRSENAQSQRERGCAEINTAKTSMVSLMNDTRSCVEIFKRGGPAIISGPQQAARTTTSLNQNKRDVLNSDTKKTGGAQAGPIDMDAKRRTLSKRKNKFNIRERF